MKITLTPLLKTLIITFYIVLFVSCTNDNSSPGHSPPASSLELLSTNPYTIDGLPFQIENYKLMTATGSVYFQVLPGCNNSCPTVVVSMPYNGIPWTNDPNDIRWATNFPTGALTLDIDGPDFIANSGQQIAFYNSSISETVGFGGLFLPSGVTAVLVYNRFYLGRKMNQYVDDFVSVVNSLSRFSYIDQSKIAFLGASLGGFVSFHASRFTQSKPVAIAGITPLIDLKSENAEMSSVATRITSNPTLLLSTQNFFNSYIRRMNGLNLDLYTSQALANENTSSSFLVIHDTWDTIVSINQHDIFSTQKQINSYIFQHATPINYNSFTMDHAQSSEGYTNEKIIPIYMAYLLKRLKSSSENKIIYYNSTSFLTGISEIRLAQNRSQNISWFKNFIEDLCTDGFILKDYATSGNLGQLTGQQMAGGIIVNVWGLPTTINNGCSYLAANPNIFN